MVWPTPYWALPDPVDLLNKSEHIATLSHYDDKFGNPSSYRAQQLSDLLRRLEKGMPLYSDDTTPELLKELTSIYSESVRTDRKMTRQDIIKQLDEFNNSKSSFHGFLDLPPELRERIYYFLFFYTDNAYHLQQPAVSRICSLIRKESLPIFYSTNRFGVNVERTVVRYGLVRQIIADTWPTFISNQHIGMMRFFEINLLGNKTRIRVKVDLPCKLNNEELSINVWSVTPEKYMASPHLMHLQRQVEKQMRPVIEGLLREPGVGAFTTRQVQQMALATPVAIELRTVMNGNPVFSL